MNNKEAFLLELAKNEDDTATRLVYADYLEEQGETDEADRQRKWPAAKAWIMEFVEPFRVDEDDYYPDMDYATLMRLANQAVEDQDHYHINCGPHEDLQSALSYEGKEFWANWSIVTGKPSPDPESVTYGCAC